MSDFQCSMKRFFLDMNHYLATVKSKWVLKVQSEFSPLESALKLFGQHLQRGPIVLSAPVVGEKLSAEVNN